MKTINSGRIVGGLLAIAYLSTSMTGLLPQSSVRAERAESLTDGLVSWWKFNETSGSTANDSMGNNDGALQYFGSGSSWHQLTSELLPVECDYANTGSVYLTPSTEGSEGAVTVGPHASLRPTSITVSGWVLRSPGSEGWSPIVNAALYDYLGEEEEDGYPVAGYDLSVSSDILWFGVGVPGGDTVTVRYFNYSEIIPDSAWHHIAATYDETTGDASIYLDGELMATEDGEPGQIQYAYGEEPVPPFEIGRGYTWAGDESSEAFHRGFLDDIRVYNRSLESEEISQLADRTCEDEAVPDDDGISDEVEDAAPNNGDGNNDGTLDSTQKNVTSLVSPESNNYVTLETTGGCDLSNVAVTSEDSKDVKDGDYSYPSGLLNFTAACDEANVRVFFHGASGTTVRKYNPSSNTYFTIADATTTTQTIDGQSVTVVTYTVIDGGELDVDGEDNGVIVDPVGLAVLGVNSTPTSTTDVDELPATGSRVGIVAMIGWSMILAGVCLWVSGLRRRKFA